MKHFNSVGLKTKKPTNKFISWLFAEAGGFEPPVPLRVRQFSKLVVSATHPHFHEFHASFPLIALQKTAFTGGLMGEKWDSNPRPSEPQSDALTN